MLLVTVMLRLFATFCCEVLMQTSGIMIAVRLCTLLLRKVLIPWSASSSSTGLTSTCETDGGTHPCRTQYRMATMSYPRCCPRLVVALNSKILVVSCVKHQAKAISNDFVVSSHTVCHQKQETTTSGQATILLLRRAT
eukprot:Rmarinus@m.19454